VQAFTNSKETRKKERQTDRKIMQWASAKISNFFDVSAFKGPEHWTRSSHGATELTLIFVNKYTKLLNPFEEETWA